MPVPTDIHNHFADSDRFCHPDWDAVASLIDDEIEACQREASWDEVCLMWLERLRTQATGDYRIHEMGRCLLLTDASDRIALRSLSVATATIQWLEQRFPGVFSGTGYGKHIILVFSEIDDYYRYIAHFDSDGEHPMSQGTCVYGSGYVHIVLLATHFEYLSPVLVHELTHACLAHLPIPVWINEALAMRVEYEICRTGVPKLDREIYERHKRHWNPESIQDFWSGRSWRIPGDSFELAYGLAYVLWHKMEVDVQTSSDQFAAFLLGAHFHDGGQAAYKDVFDHSLFELATGFLGPGEWEPRPGTWSQFFDSSEG